MISMELFLELPGNVNSGFWTHETLAAGSSFASDAFYFSLNYLMKLEIQIHNSYEK